MNRKYSISSMKELAKDRGLDFLSDVYTTCIDKHIWKCLTCQHVWQATPANVIHKKSGCPKCAGQCQTVETMEALAKKSGIEFISKIYRGMKEKHQWKCPDGHCWHTTPMSIKRGSRCHQCSTRIKEEKCRFVFESLTGYKFPSVWNMLSVKMQLDGYCEELNIAFEYQGKQHYQKVPYFHRKNGDLENQQERDSLKSKLCQERGIRKIDVPYTEAVSNQHLERFIAIHLCDMSLNASDWSEFVGKPGRLEETKKIAHRMNLKCLSEIYIDAKTKLSYKCLGCNHVWESTPSNIKTGYGCPVCGYVKRAKSRKETMRYR